MFKHSIVLLAMLLLSLTILSQERGQHSGNMPADGIISGYVIDAKTNHAIEYANVTVYAVRDSSIVTGGITNKKGYFYITEVKYGKFYIDIDFIGYGKYRIDNITIKPDKKEVGLGQIKLDLAAELLGEVAIEAETPRVEYKLDRKIVTPDKDLNAAGGTAVDVLENTPSVQTDIDGNVSIRGSSNFLVLIDGRPSPIQGSEALQQIPAGTIQSIEIITNPGAKYDPDGVGGIINVVLKKEKRQGINGLFSASYGSFNTLGGDFLVNIRTSVFNFFVGGDYNQRRNEGTSVSEQRTYSSDTLFVFTESERERGRTNGRIRGGFDYYISPKDVLTLSGSLGLNKMLSGTDDDFTSYWIRDGIESNRLDYFNENRFNINGMFYSGDLNYQHKFMKQGHEISTYLYFDNDSDTETNRYDQYFENPDSTGSYRTYEVSSGQNLRAQVDYILPLWDKGKFEAGYQYRQKWTNNDYKYESLISDDWQPSINNLYSFDQNIQSGYATFSHEIGKFGYMLGVRSEYTYRIIHQSNTSIPFDSVYRSFDIFPTVHISYQLPWDMQAMASYGRRINRPRGFFLDPFPEVVDAYNIRQGNPMLEPEYTDAAELNIQKRFNSNFVSFELYYKHTSNKFDRIKKLHPDNPEIMISTWENIGEDMSLGSEIMGNVNLTKWWNINLSGDFYYYEIIADGNNNTRSNNTFTWGSRINNSFKIKKSGTSFQLSGFLRGNSISSQGTTKGMGMVSAAVRQDLLDRKLTITFNVRDIFRTMGHESITDTDFFYAFSSMTRKSPTFSISVTYRLNDYNRRKDKSVERDVEGGDEL
ncbi:MAG TPA: TonB-dependent receptor [Bacteroidales bacterium]|nr:TonB-dependent receptor [Bacteroidales bacterium]